MAADEIAVDVVEVSAAIALTWFYLLIRSLAILLFQV